MTNRQKVLAKFLKEDKLKKYDVINLANINYHIKYGTNIIKNNEVHTLTTKGDFVVVVEE